MKQFALLVFSCACITVLGAPTNLAPKNPKDLCDRFIAPESRKECEGKIKKISPDWYLSTICDQQFDDIDFWNCLELSKTANFSPVKLEACNKDGLSDQEKMGCLRKLAKESSKGSAFQGARIAPSKKKGEK